MSVVSDGQKSSTKHVNAGVTQCSILKPTPLLIYINDRLDGIVSKLVMYADTTLFNSTLTDRNPTRKNVNTCVKFLIRT